MTTRRRSAWSIIAAAALVSTACTNAGSSGGAYPSKGIRIVVPYPAGGGTDITARALAPCFEDDLQTNVIVENKAGGSGAIGTNDVLSKPADGYTLAIELTSSAVITPLSDDVGYQLADLQPIGVAAQLPYMIIVPGDSPYETIEDLIEAGESGTLKAAAPGAASQGDLELRMIQQAGVALSIVPFDGTAGVKTALAGGDVDFGAAVVDKDILKQNDEGTLRILASTGAEREKYLPDVPTLNESNQFKDLGQGVSYIGVVAKKGIPDEVATSISDSLQGCLSDAKVTDIIGDEFIPDEYVDGAALMKLWQSQSTSYKPLVTETQ